MGTDQRFSDAIWNGPAKTAKTVIIGVGGVGSWLALYMGRAGYPLTLIDFDEVSAENMSGQLLLQEHTSMLKVVSIGHVVQSFGVESHVSGIPIKFDKDVGGALDCQVLICAADSMQARLDAWETYMSDDGIDMFIDVRMAMESFSVYCLTKSHPDRAGRWRDEWFDDSQADQEVCTMKATSHCGATCAAVAIGLINNRLAIQAGDMRNLPYKVSFDFQSLFSRHEP